MKIGRAFLAVALISVFSLLAVQVGLNLYWKMSLGPRIQRQVALDPKSTALELQRIRYVEQTSRLFLNAPSNLKTSETDRIVAVPDLSLSLDQKRSLNLSRRSTTWFRRGDLIRKAQINTDWMSNLKMVHLWRTPYTASRSKEGPFLGATWALARLAVISRMKMTESEALKALEDVRQLERLLLTSESHILNLQALQVMGIERDFVERHRRLFSYLNRWNLPPVDFAENYRESSMWLPRIWNWGTSSDLVNQFETAAQGNPIFCASVEKGMSDALNLRPLLSFKDPEFFQRQIRWGIEWSSVCSRPEFAKAWNNTVYIPRGIKDWTAMWNGHPSKWLKLKHVMWWKTARLLIGGQVWLDKLIDASSGDAEDDEN